MRQINEIIVHCTATRPEWMAANSAAEKVKEIRRWHLDRGFSDIGYHYIIDRDGTIARGRPVERQGAHVRGRNANSIGVSLVGGFGGATTDAFADNFTPAQDAALRALLRRLRKDHPGVVHISGHSEYAAKACPCFAVRAWLNQQPHRPEPVAPPAREFPAQGIAAVVSRLFSFMRGKP